MLHREARFPSRIAHVGRCGDHVPLVQDAGDGSHSTHILRAVVGLAASLGMDTTAEGVETADQLARVQAEGCTEVQGFYFSAPRAAHEIPAMLAGMPAELVA